jgi:hypothetical protein
MDLNEKLRSISKYIHKNIQSITRKILTIQPGIELDV